MNIGIQECSRGVVVRLDGDLTVDSGQALKVAVTDLVAGRQTAIIFDMSGVGFIDSQGLELLLWIRDYCQLSLIPFRLAGLDGNCRKILEITRLDGEFSAMDDLNEAMQSLA